MKNKDGVQEIPVVTIDDYCRQHSITIIRYLKLDIEGFELSALQGAKNLLQQGAIDVIQLEINNALSYSGVSVLELISCLDSFGYQLSCYNVSKKIIEKVGFTEERENYFAIKSIEKLNQQIKEKLIVVNSF